MWKSYLQKNKIISIIEQTRRRMMCKTQMIDLTKVEQLQQPGVQYLSQLFKENQFELRLCGGAVRDILSGKTPKDLDFATTATPEEMIEMFDRNDVRRDINSQTGITHGTVTCRLFEENFEVTTLRIDQVTDGRHAQVVFTHDWAVDASRRDLTINSMFLGLDGMLYDYYNGREHLKQKSVRFVNDPAQRIQEDYLRILRYFRFYGRIADDTSAHDDVTIQALKEHGHGLAGISGERIWSELDLILRGARKKELITQMHECGLLPHMGFPLVVDMEELGRVCDRVHPHLDPNPMIFIAAMLSGEDELTSLRKKLKFSNNDNSIATFILRNRHINNGGGCDVIDKYEDVLVSTYRKDRNALTSFFELMKYFGDVRAIDHFKDYQIPKFPVNGKSVKEVTGKKGKIIGTIIDKLFGLWKESRYTMTENELLSKLDV